MIRNNAFNNKATTVGVIALVVTLYISESARAALRLVETIPGIDFNVGQMVIEQSAVGTTGEAIHGVGMTALWTAVIADESGGTFPWSLDLSVEVVAPDGSTMLTWPEVGGDSTIADYPLQDATGGFAGVSGVGEFTFLFLTAAPSPYVSGLRDVQYHLLTNEPDVVDVSTGTTSGGPIWNRPFFIGGISGLGPVSYHAMQFVPAVPGRYTFESVVVGEDNFNFIYQDNFNPNDPLTDLLDYGLGNGNAPNGTPAGTSLIDVLLLPNRTYTYVTSQWAASTPAVPFTTTVTGPGSIVAVCISCAAGDFNGDDTIDLADYGFFADCVSGPGATPAPTATGASADQCQIAFDADDDGDVDLADYSMWLSVFGP